MNKIGVLRLRNIAVIAVLAGALFTMMSGAALAAYPHTDFDAQPDACAACHRMHTATASNLLKDPTGSCKSCHADGLAADTDVENGTYIAVSGEDATSPSHVWGANGATLLGGGFDYVATATTTSKHSVDGGNLIPPGTDTGASITFTCTSCHSAHFNKDYPNQYRLLRADVNGQTGLSVTWNGPWTDLTQATQGGEVRAYTDTDFVGGTAGVQYYTKNYKTGISEWCAACHVHYLATPSGGGYNGYKNTDTYDAGDTYGAAVRHRHTVNTVITGRYDPISQKTYNLVTDMPLADLTANSRSSDDLLVCLSCHRAHGSAAAMQGNAVLENRGTVLPSGADSMLLRTDDRAMCRDCHGL